MVQSRTIRRCVRGSRPRRARPCPEYQGFFGSEYCRERAPAAKLFCPLISWLGQLLRSAGLAKIPGASTHCPRPRSRSPRAWRPVLRLECRVLAERRRLAGGAVGVFGRAVSCVVVRRACCRAAAGRSGGLPCGLAAGRVAGGGCVGAAGFPAALAGTTGAGRAQSLRRTGRALRIGCPPPSQAAARAVSR